MTKLENAFKQVGDIFRELSNYVEILIIAIAMLVVVCAAIFFFKKDRQGSEEGKSMLMRVAMALFVAIAGGFFVTALVAFIRQLVTG